MAGIQSASFVRFLRRAMVDVRIGLQCGKVKLLDEVVTIPAGVAGKGRGLAQDAVLYVEQALNEEQMVLMNRFKSLATKAIDEINADRRYKMIINAVSVVDADPSLNISDLVLERVNVLYEAGELK